MAEGQSNKVTTEEQQIIAGKTVELKGSSPIRSATAFALQGMAEWERNDADKAAAKIAAEQTGSDSEKPAGQ
jgi:hypothetical protein